MKRDMDLIRELLLKLESLVIRPGGVCHILPDDPEISVPGYDEATIEYHLLKIREAGLIDTGGSGPMQGISFRALSWDGHEFLDTIRDPEVWKKTKQGAAAAGGFTVDLLKDLAKGYIRKQVEDKTGVKL